MMKTFRELKEYDMFDLGDISYSDAIVPSDFRVEPIFNEAVIKIVSNGHGEKVSTYTYVNSNGTIEYYLYRCKTYEFLPCLKVKTYMVENKLKFEVLYMNEMYKVNDKEIETIIHQTLHTMSYLSYVATTKETIYKTIKEKKAAEKKSSSKASAKRRVELLNGNRIIYVNANKDTIKDMKTYQRHIDSWNVAGHPRTYKSGKVIFIKPYKKGEGRVNPKTYEIAY